MSIFHKSIVGVAGAIAALALVPQPAEAGTVVAASGPSASRYPVGTQITDTQRITLQTGDSITVLAEGRTRVLRGPGTFVLAQRSGRTDNSALASLTTRRAAGQARVASSRGDGTPVRNPNLWYVDVAQNGTICLANADPVQLWRGDTDAAASYAMARRGAPDDAVTITFAQREMLGVWGGALQLREGETYRIAPRGSAAAVEVRFVFLREVPADGEALALALIENGCNVQLEQLAVALGTADQS